MMRGSERFLFEQRDRIKAVPRWRLLSGITEESGRLYALFYKLDAVFISDAQLEQMQVSLEGTHLLETPSQESLEASHPTFHIGDTCVINSLLKTVDLIGVRAGETVYGSIVFYSKFPASSQILWFEAKDLKKVDNELVKNIPSEEADEESWEMWMQRFGREIFQIPKHFFTPETCRAYFYTDSLTPEQENAFRALYTDSLILDLLEQKKQENNPVAFQGIIREEIIKHASGNMKAPDIHDWVIHAAIAQRDAGNDSSPSLQRPVFRIDGLSAEGIAEEVAAVSYGFVMPFLQTAEASFIKEFGYKALTPKAFTGYMVKKFREPNNISTDPEKFHYRYAITPQEIQKAEENFSALEANPPQWLMDIIWPLIDRHPDSLLNQHRIDQDFDPKTLDPAIGPKILHAFISHRESV